MDAGRHVVTSDRIAVQDGDVIAAVAVVPEAHHLKASEPARQVDNGGDLHAHLLVTEPRAFVVGLGGQDVFDLLSTQQHRRLLLPQRLEARRSMKRAASARPAW